jgi:Holliday junction resolvase RusA-like endonuclease
LTIPAMDNSPSNPTPVSPTAAVAGRINLDEPPILIRLFVPAVPVAQPRPRAFTVGGKARMGDVPTKHPVHDFKASVRMAFRAAYQGRPLGGPVRMTCVFIMPRPRAMIWKTKPMPRVPYCAGKNDWDNLGKAVSDSLLKVAYYDDGQLWKVCVERWIAAGDEAPHAEILIEQ